MYGAGIGEERHCRQRERAHRAGAPICPFTPFAGEGGVDSRWVVVRLTHQRRHLCAADGDEAGARGAAICQPKVHVAGPTHSHHGGTPYNSVSAAHVILGAAFNAVAPRVMPGAIARQPGRWRQRTALNITAKGNLSSSGFDVCRRLS